MSYDKKHIPILNPEIWYNKIYANYKKFHNFLNTFDKNLWQRFLPRDLKWKTVVDLWCWDWRINKFFIWKWIKKYIWIDISEKMLQQVKNYVIKIKHDLNTPLPIQDNTIDIVICLFVLLHIDNIKLLFSEIYRILTDNGVFVLFHHIERKNYVYWQWNNKFKIHTNKWSYKEIENLLEYSFFKFKVYDVKENWILIGKYFLWKK